MKRSKISKNKVPLLVIIGVIIIAVLISLASFVLDRAQYGPAKRNDVLALRPMSNATQFEMDVSLELVKLHKVKSIILDASMKADNVDVPFQAIIDSIDSVIQVADSSLRQIATMNPSDAKSKEKKSNLVALIQQVIAQAEETKTLVELGNVGVIQKALQETMRAIDRVIEFDMI